jgi:hypothetical protein
MVNIAGGIILAVIGLVALGFALLLAAAVLMRFFNGLDDAKTAVLRAQEKWSKTPMKSRLMLAAVLVLSELLIGVSWYLEHPS